MIEAARAERVLCGGFARASLEETNRQSRHRQAIDAADTKPQLEDLYLPYRPLRRTTGPHRPPSAVAGTDGNAGLRRRPAGLKSTAPHCQLNGPRAPLSAPLRLRGAAL